MKLFNKIMFVFFLLIGAAGLLFAVEPGVFIGLGLAPWQLYELGVKKKGYLYFTVLATLGGLAFMVIKGSSWLVFLLFIALESFNIWKYYGPQKVEETKNLEEGK
ncbi:MAG: hypothetical protein ACOCQ1_03880 [Halanaerobiaceae bacterium]